MNTVEFLDVTETFSPFMKANSNPIYVHAQSNHPPSILKNIPLAVNRRLCEISSNGDIFKKAIPPYQEALHSHILKFEPAMEAPKRKDRRRKILWFNPPYSAIIARNVGKKFLNIIDKNFPPGHILHKILK